MKSIGSVALNCAFSGALRPDETRAAAFALFDAIVRLPERECPLVVFADPRFPGIADWKNVSGLTFVEVPFSQWSLGKTLLWEQFILPARCRKMGCAIAHHPIATCPAINRRVKSIVTLYDLNFLKHPHWYTRVDRARSLFAAFPGLLRAWRIVTVSDYIHDEAARRLGISQDHLRRVYHGIRFTADFEPFAHTNVPYILCLGSLQPHKNLARLILAFRLLRERHPGLELWIVGHPDSSQNRLPELQGLLETPGLQIPGHLTDPELRAAYANALAFCCPSLEEGFAISILEAMTCGTPVAASSAACIPEIAGGHAELFDPFSPHSIAASIQAILDLTPEQREERVSGARLWAAAFNWQAAARQYLCIYQELA